MPREERLLELGPGRRLRATLAGEGPDVLYFPGNGCSSADMGLLIDRIAERYRFIGLDGPGRAGVEWPDEPFDFLTDMPPAMDRALELLGIGPHVAVGHSMGGMYALQHANRRRGDVRGLALLEGFVTLGVHRRNAAPDGFRPVNMAPEVAEAWRRRSLDHREWLAERPAFLNSFWPSQHAHDARPWVGELGVPILVLIGGNGQDVPADLDGWREALEMRGVADLTVQVIPRSGHWMMLDNPQATGDALMAFLARALPARP